jgi:hypothetical protein
MRQWRGNTGGGRRCQAAGPAQDACGGRRLWMKRCEKESSAASRCCNARRLQAALRGGAAQVASRPLRGIHPRRPVAATRASRGPRCAAVPRWSLRAPSGGFIRDVPLLQRAPAAGRAARRCRAGRFALPPGDSSAPAARMNGR